MRVALWILLAGCTSGAATEVDFQRIDGTADGMSDCRCQLTGTTVQVTCGSPTLAAVVVELDATTSGAQPVSIYFGEDRALHAGGTASLGALGEPNPDGDLLVRDIDDLTISWDFQYACRNGDCEFDEVDPYRLDAGAVRGGHGGCATFAD